MSRPLAPRCPRAAPPKSCMGQPCARNGVNMEEAPFSQVIGSNLAAVRGRIDAAARTAGRPEDAVTLVAVSKTHPIDAVRAALRAGQRIFGENRVQEALGKFPALRREMDKSGRRPSCLIEVNTGEEPQKAGILPEAADAFIRDCRDRLQLPIAGLMCIPPEHEEPALHFALLREIARRNGLDQLSMGMSADFETAIRFGATHVRVGTAIFGARRMVSEAAAAG